MAFALMEIVQRADTGKWWITQPGWEDYGPFDSEDAAQKWADSNIDDQVTGNPNMFAKELRTQKAK